MAEKLPWRGQLTSVQPRIRLTRSFDQRSHTYLGFALRVEGAVGEHHGAFTVGIGKAAQAKHGFQAGDVVAGEAEPVADARLEPVAYYKAAKLTVIERRRAGARHVPPPWVGPPPDLETYRARGHRRLDARTDAATCAGCLWGCTMAVEIILDQWHPSKRKYRQETFCYGPKACASYRAGPTRKVPGRQGMMWEEEDWVDEDATAHRGPDE